MEVYKREVERKFVVEGMSYEMAYDYLTTTSRATVPTTTSFDLYWKAPGVDFVRLRDNSHELTVKVSDKGTVVDRIEENVEVTKDSMSAAKRLMTLLHGKPMNLTKQFSVFEEWIGPAPGTSFKVVYCLYQVDGDPLGRVFFEVEAESLAVVDYALDNLSESFKLKAVNKSLYDIFFKEGVL